MLRELNMIWKQETKDFLEALKTFEKAGGGLSNASSMLSDLDLSLLDIFMVKLSKKLMRSNFIVFLPLPSTVVGEDNSGESNSWKKFVYNKKTWGTRYAEYLNETFDIRISGNMVECIDLVADSLVKMDFSNVNFEKSKSKEAKLLIDFLKDKWSTIEDYLSFCKERTSYQSGNAEQGNPLGDFSSMEEFEIALNELGEAVVFAENSIGDFTGVLSDDMEEDFLF